MKVKSPLTNSTNVFLEKEIESKYILDGYQNQDWINVDVKKYFNDLEYIKVYRCEETGYRFYYPFNIAGDEKFYRTLQNYPWYYVDWKWEYDVASKMINSKDVLLEVGCARGAFIEKMKQRGAICTGIELNKDAIEVARAKELDIRYETIEEHAESNAEKYDVVCFFQVLEHIVNVKDFLQASVKVLKPGGKLIIGVPNNDAYIKYAKNLVTNMPPHHMGLWNKKSLRSIQTLFPLKLKSFYFEPLDYSEWYYYIHRQRLLNALSHKSKIVARSTQKLSDIISKPPVKLLNLLKNLIHGHSMLAKYTKLG